jgi:hypothetical protein
MRLPLGQRARFAILALVSIVAIVAVALHAPIPQPAGYHEFADRREFLGIPNFWNVMSNLPFLIVGLAGMRQIATRAATGIIASMRIAYFCLFAGIVLVGLGSAFYHFAPSDPALTWDRLPMTVSFMAFFAIVIGEHIDAKAGLRLLAPLLLLGAASVLYWHFTERAGHGDLRPYVVVQFLPLLLVPLVLILFPSRLSHGGLLWGLLGAYLAAKLLEKADGVIFSWGHLLSGHSLKHLTAAFGMYLFLLAIKLRRPVALTPEPFPPPRDTANAKI